MYAIIESTLLKAPDGFMIEKSWERHSVTNRIKPDSIVYTVCTEDGEGLVGAYKTLKEAWDACKER